MNYRIRDGLSWCLCEGQAVFLDLDADRYFGLRPEDNICFQQWQRSGEASGIDLAGLTRAGIALPCSLRQAPLARTQVATAAFDLGDEPDGSVPIRAIIHALLAQRRATRLVRSGRLSEMIEAVKTGRNPGEAPVDDAAPTMRRIAAVFASTPLSWRKAGQCLPRALAAYSLCRRAGLFPMLVFGVRLEPFAAHCWLQAGPNVIVGDLEQARMFTPILAIS